MVPSVTAIYTVNQIFFKCAPKDCTKEEGLLPCAAKYTPPPPHSPHPPMCVPSDTVSYSISVSITWPSDLHLVWVKCTHQHICFGCKEISSTEKRTDKLLMEF